MRAALLLAVLLLAAPAVAQEAAPVPDAGEKAVTASEFEAMVEGRTLTYGAEGQAPYGVEHYHPDRRVTWAFTDSDECKAGAWYAEGPADSPAICFLYDDDPVAKCWRFFREGEALRAIYLNDGGSTVLYELVDDPGSLVCGGVGA